MRWFIFVTSWKRRQKIVMYMSINDNNENVLGYFNELVDYQGIFFSISNTFS